MGGGRRRASEDGKTGVSRWALLVQLDAKRCGVLALKKILWTIRRWSAIDWIRVSLLELPAQASTN